MGEPDRFRGQLRQPGQGPRPEAGGLPPPGAPNVMLAAGGTQLRKDIDDDGIYAWSFHVDWKDPSKTKVTGPVKIANATIALATASTVRARGARMRRRPTWDMPMPEMTTSSSTIG